MTVDAGVELSLLFSGCGGSAGRAKNSTAHKAERVGLSPDNGGWGNVLLHMGAGVTKTLKLLNEFLPCRRGVSAA